jgi:L-amino acid N-acyltransferase YncA
MNTHEGRHERLFLTKRPAISDGWSPTQEQIAARMLSPVVDGVCPTHAQVIGASLAPTHRTCEQFRYPMAHVLELLSSISPLGLAMSTYEKAIEEPSYATLN